MPLLIYNSKDGPISYNSGRYPWSPEESSLTIPPNRDSAVQPPVTRT